YVEAISQLAANRATLGNQGLTALRLFNQIQYRIDRIGLGLVIEIQAGLQVNINAPSEQRNVYVRRHGNTRSIFQGARFDGIDRPLTDIRGRGPAKAVEGFFQIVVAVVDAFVIGLPELQERIANQVT